tara:strand:+ start:327 stop:530 length:204 start_codon:yes stop_codon:yes gene_type:complete
LGYTEQRTDSSDPAVEGLRLHPLGFNLAAKLVHPVLGQRWIDLPEMKVRVVPVTPPYEAADFASVAL